MTNSMTNTQFIQRLKDAGVNTTDALNRFMGNESLFLSFMKRLPENLHIDKIEQALEENDGEGFYFHMHNLKGVCGNLGLTDIYDAAQAALVEYRSTQLRNPKKMAGLLTEIGEDAQKILILLREDAPESEVEQ